MRTISVLALVAWAVTAPSALRAAELTFSVDGNAEYDSNVFRSSRDEDDDYIFRLTPAVRLSDDRSSDLRYALTYSLPVEFAAQNSDINDVDQRIGGDVLYHVNDRFSVFAGDDFRYLRSELLTNFEETEGGFDSLLVNEERDRILLNSARGGGTYQFTPRLAGTSRFEHEYYNPSRDDRATTNAYIGTGSMQYALTPKHKVGGGARAQWQTFDDTQDIVGSTAQSYSVFGSWDWAATERIGFSVAVGPALIRNEQDDPNRTEMRSLVPAKNRGPFTAGPGLLRPDGITPVPVGEVFEDGALLVGNVGRCARAVIEGVITPVIDAGKSCQLNVVLDRTPGEEGNDLIGPIEAALPVTLTNTDPNGESSTDLTFFALATGRVDWTPTLHSALSYRRDQGTASGLGGTVVSDLVQLVNTYEFTEKWNFSTRGEFSLRKSVDEATRTLFLARSVDFGDLTTDYANIAGFASSPGATDGTIVTQRAEETEIDTMRWGFAGRVTHFLTRNTSGYLQFTYNQQKSRSDSLGDPSDFDDYLVTLGVTHVFQPIKLW
jgi:hypothetical protein